MLTVFLIAMLWELFWVCLIAAIVYGILMLLGIPANFRNFVWAFAAIVFLIWLLQHAAAAGMHLRV
jgi:hypothetical protein